MGTPLSGAPWMTQLPQFKPGIFAGVLHAQQNQIMQENQRRGWEMDDLNQASQRTQNELEALKLAENQKEAQDVSPLARQDRIAEYEKNRRMRPIEEQTNKEVLKDKEEQAKDNQRKREAIANAEFLGKLQDDVGTFPPGFEGQTRYMKYVDEAEKRGIKLPPVWDAQTKDNIAKVAEVARRNIPGMRAQLDKEERENIQRMRELAVQESTRAAIQRDKDAEALERVKEANKGRLDVQELKGQQALEALQYKIQNSTGKAPNMSQLEAHAVDVVTGKIPSTPEELESANNALKYIINKTGLSNTLKAVQEAAVAKALGIGKLSPPPAEPAAAAPITPNPRAGQLPSTSRGSGPDTVPPMPTSLGPIPPEANRIYAQSENPMKDVTDLDRQIRDATSKPGNKNPNQIPVLQEERQKALRAYFKSEGVIFNANGQPIDTPENRKKYADAKKKYESVKK